MHNVLKIALLVRREPLTITLSVEGYTDLKTIVHFYSMRVTKFGIWGGSNRPRLLPMPSKTPHRPDCSTSDNKSVLK